MFNQFFFTREYIYFGGAIKKIIVCIYCFNLHFIMKTFEIVAHLWSAKMNLTFILYGCLLINSGLIKVSRGAQARDYTSVFRLFNRRRRNNKSE